ncbi:MAG: CinA family nicotinamide mononucleotide deamidase-related protein [Candidatus Neomarinimicrobiota bacterium]
MKIALITIGAELLNGTRADTNAAWIGQAVISIGGNLCWHRTVPDIKKDIISALDEIPASVQAVILTGGLGPTPDDITASVLYNYFDTVPVFDEKYWNELKEKFNKRGKTIPDSNRNQALRPKKGNLINNPNGSARGLNFTNKNYSLFSLPGVPSEMKEMMKASVLPWIKSRSKQKVFVEILRTVGIMESALYQKLTNILNEYKDVEVAFLPRFTGVDLRLSASNINRAENFILAARKLIGKYYYGSGDVELESVLGKMLTEKKLTVATAESCTGGLIADRLTNTPGSSAYMQGGIIAYNNEVKINLLKVRRNTLIKWGAVSEMTAVEMAAGVKEIFKADIGISATGIAGPGGGSGDKPVGLVYIGLVHGQVKKAFKFHFTAKRKINKMLSSQAALNLLRMHLLNG